MKHIQSASVWLAFLWNAFLCIFSFAFEANNTEAYEELVPQRKSLAIESNSRPVRRIELCNEVCADPP